jgi:serine protease inhibitor
MSATTSYDYFWSEEFQVIDVPMTLLECTDCDLFVDTLKSDLMTFQIWLPEKNLKTEQDHIDFQQVIAEKRASIRKDMASSRIELVMPKMKLDFDEDITDGFKDLGVNKVFEYGQHFDPLFGSGTYPNTAISEIQHAVKLDIDEAGMEGAAATAAIAMFRSFSPAVNVDRPFYFSVQSACYKGEDVPWGEPIMKESSDCFHDRTAIFQGKVVSFKVGEK